MEDKYNGCNIVESVLKSASVKRRAPRREEKQHRGFWVRLTVAAALVGAVLALHFLAFVPWIGVSRETLRDVFCYDVFGRDEFGITETTVFGG